MIDLPEFLSADRSFKPPQEDFVETLHAALDQSNLSLAFNLNGRNKRLVLHKGEFVEQLLHYLHRLYTLIADADYS